LRVDLVQCGRPIAVAGFLFLLYARQRELEAFGRGAGALRLGASLLVVAFGNKPLLIKSLEAREFLFGVSCRRLCLSQAGAHLGGSGESGAAFFLASLADARLLSA